MSDVMKNDIDEEDLPNYQIFWIDDKQLKHVVLKFKAENDTEAYARLDKYNILHVEHEHYYGKVHYVKCLGKDGKLITRCMFDDMMDDEHRNIFIKACEAVLDFLTYWIWQKPVDWWYKLKDIAYLLKHKEARSNQWNLDQHLIDTIILNVPNLIENSHGLMFLDEAIEQIHGSEPGFDLKAYHMKYCSGYPEDIEQLAVKIQNEEYNKLLLNARLYKYYIDAGIVDSDNLDEVEFNKTWRHTLPVKPGTYDEFDYEKLNELHQTAWNNVWEWVKKHGHTLYD